MNQLEFNIIKPQLSNRSPLMYPGGKSRSFKTFKHYLPTDVKEMVSPFIGGGGIELNCAARGIKVIGFDNLEPLVNFWRFFLMDPSALMDKVLELRPLTYEERHYYYTISLKAGENDFSGQPYSDFERAALFLLINRQSFRGWTLVAQPARKYDEPSIAVDLLRKFKDWHNPNISVAQSDYKATLDRFDGTFMYLDPPYVDKEHFYGSKQSNNSFDHEEFAHRVTKLSNRWILSYIKHDLIMEMYKDYRIVEYNHRASIGGSVKPNTELFIMNY